MPKKLVLTGARSAMFTGGLLAYIIEENFLGPWEIGLIDIAVYKQAFKSSWKIFTSVFMRKPLIRWEFL